MERTRRRIVFVLPDLAGGGAQRVMTTFAAALDRHRFETTLLVIGDGNGPWAAAAHAAGRVEALGISRLQAALFALPARLRALAPDVVVSTMGYVNLAILAMRPILPRRTALVVREANEPAATIASLPAWMPARYAYRRLYPTADLVIAPSRRILSTLARDANVAPAKMSWVANPTDAEALRRRATAPTRVPGIGRRLVAAGRMTRQKGFDRLLDLVSLLPDDVHISIFGDGPEREALDARVEAERLSHRIAIHAFSEALPDWIAGADALVVPSRWEGLPNVALEALALGTPVIGAPEAGGLEELAADAQAVRIAAIPKDFVQAIASLPIRSEIELGPSLLPLAYRREVAGAEFAKALELTMDNIVRSSARR